MNGPSPLSRASLTPRVDDHVWIMQNTDSVDKKSLGMRVLRLNEGRTLYVHRAGGRTGCDRIALIAGTVMRTVNGLSDDFHGR